MNERERQIMDLQGRLIKNKLKMIERKLQSILDSFDRYDEEEELELEKTPVQVVVKVGMRIAGYDVHYEELDWL